MNRSRSQIAFALAVVLVASLHFGLSVFLGAITQIAEASGWDLVAKILAFPMLSTWALDGLPKPLFWALWAALSLSWGFAICTLIRRAFS